MKRLSVGLAFAALTFAGEWFPLQSGNTWTYREASSGHEFTVRVGTPLMQDGRAYYPLDGFVTEKVLVRIDERGDLVYLADVEPRERILVSFTPDDRFFWFAHLRGCDTDGQAQPRRGIHDGPAGPFRDVLEIRYRPYACADAGTLAEQYAENIGMLRRVESSIAGPRQYDLVYARVGKQVIDAHTFGRFTVSMGRTSGPEWDVVLRAQTDALGIKLSFASMQEYEIVLKNEDGAELWRWSDGQSFAQWAHGRSFSGEWRINAKMPRPPAPGLYTVEAWLNTVEGTPRLSAVTAFAVLP